MATISENLQIIKNSTDAIKQAIIDKGGDASGDITTWASAISGLSGGGGSELKKFTLSYTEFLFENDMTWSDFVNSIYNIKHYIPYLYISDKITTSGNIVDGTNGINISTSSSSYVPVAVTDKIIPNGTYYHWMQSGGDGN